MAASPRAAASTTIVTNSTHIRTTAKLNPRFWLGNLDDPAPPDDYRPNEKHRLARWNLRNPGHNFDFYVIGVADKTFRRSGRYPERVFKTGKGWNWTVTKYKSIRLPFLSYIHGRFKFYIVGGSGGILVWSLSFDLRGISGASFGRHLWNAAVGRCLRMLPPLKIAAQSQPNINACGDDLIT